jgi:hypothetical protein
MPGQTWQQRKSDRREFSRDDWTAFYRQMQQETAPKQMDFIERLDDLFRPIVDKPTTTTTTDSNHNRTTVVVVAKFAAEILFREPHGSAVDELKRYIDDGRPLDIRLLLGAVSLTRFTDASIGRYVGVVSGSQAMVKSAKSSLLPTTVLDPSTVIAADPPADRLPLSTAVPNRYQSICLLLLKSAADRYNLSKSEESSINLWTTLRLIEFHRFAGHDQSFDVLLDVITTAEARHDLATTDDEKKRCFAVAHLARHRAFNDHTRLSLDKLRLAKSNPIVPADFIQASLLSEERETAAAVRLRQREAEDARLLELRKRLPTTTYAVGQVIDVSDVEHWNNRFCPAEILDLKTDAADGTIHIYIKYIGWTDQYNIWINTSREAARLAPLGTHTDRRQLVRLLPIDEEDGGGGGGGQRQRRPQPPPPAARNRRPAAGQHRRPDQPVPPEVAAAAVAIDSDDSDDSDDDDSDDDDDDILE